MFSLISGPFKIVLLLLLDFTGECLKLIEVSIEVDGPFTRLRVTAEDKATKKSQTFLSKLHRLMSSEEERMEKKYQERERKEEERIHARKKLKSFTNIMENGSADELALAAEEIDSDAIRLIEKALGDAAAWLDDNPNATKDDYAQKLKALELLLHHFI